ncbi:MAG: hypothetical protein IK114_03900 [Fibrobacter sp.]|nr:hypothetical protein [Fibrobacter sp.]
MAIHIDDTKPFPQFLQETNNKRETFADFCKRQAEGLKLISDEMEQDDRELEELGKLREKRIERKKKLFYDNLDLILRHKDEILATPRYANIDAHYLLKGGGLYVGHLNMARQFNIAGNVVIINLRLASLFKIWGSDQFRVECECGTTTFIRGFAGSPLSGSSQASAICPKCKKIVRVDNRSFGAYCGIVNAAYAEDIEKFAKALMTKWTLAEVEYEKKIVQGKSARWFTVGDAFKDDGEICELETMINELKLKEFEASTSIE